MKALYCYFGLLGNNDINIPGHIFYQFPLIVTLAKYFNISTFDFYSYLPYNIKSKKRFEPFDNIDEYYYSKYIDNHNISLSEVFDNIMKHKYDIVFLKARFRNLSTLSKKWVDTLKYEKIIEYSKKYNIKTFILDTDLSITYDNQLSYLKIQKLDTNVILKYMQKYKKIKKENYIIYHGNIDTSSYNKGHSKSKFIYYFLSTIPQHDVMHRYYIASKNKINFRNTIFIPRYNRKQIHNIYSTSKYSINITKNLYTEKHFIPARIFESLMYYSLPLSYNFDFLLPYLSFHNITQYLEVLKYFDSIETYDKVFNDLLDKITCKGGKFDEL